MILFAMVARHAAISKPRASGDDPVRIILGEVRGE